MELMKTVQKAARPGCRVRNIREKVASHLWHEPPGHRSYFATPLICIFLTVQPYPESQIFYGCTAMNTHINFKLLLRYPHIYLFLCNLSRMAKETV